MTERVIDEQGNILWEEVYVFRKPSKPGEHVIRSNVEYIILSSRIVFVDVIETVVRQVEELS